MPLMQHLADADRPGSFSNRLRSRRFRLFERLTGPMRASMERPLRIVDLGGTAGFWEHRGWAGRSDVEITTVNHELDSPDTAGYANIRAIRGDVTDLDHLADDSFDVAFSNSVIEHLYTPDRQAMMAAQMRRLASAFWLQTPNYWFPMEPHFHVVGWQWMPIAVRKTVIKHRRCGWRGPCRDVASADATVREVRLMTRGQLRRLFPDAVIMPERFGGLVKSWIIHAGFPPVHETDES